MPTPYGSRGGVAFSADELRVLGGALAIALQSGPTPEEAREYLRLAEAVDETVREGYRLRSFLLADLARYRGALPGAAVGYLDQVEAALTAGYLPRPDDIVALRSLCEEAVSAPEAARRRALLLRCERLSERAVRSRLRVLPHGRVPVPAPASEPPSGSPSVPQPGPVSPESPESPEAADDGGTPGEQDEPESPEAPQSPEPSSEPSPPPAPGRPVPTPAEVFPPRRDPSEPSGPPEQPEPPESPEPSAPPEEEHRRAVPA
ncbi:hypothetical protein GCM10009801_80930 [Streptomyces albiaxialis]|uniref:Uncharacterized protein n=1 Tax=Streptomyces albiaxialis TaxID=329523 RepID=A0ABN2X4L1_9ACTN